jgi:hypothetical protein
MKKTMKGLRQFASLLFVFPLEVVGPESLSLPLLTVSVESLVGSFVRELNILRLNLRKKTLAVGSLILGKPLQRDQASFAVEYVVIVSFAAFFFYFGSTIFSIGSLIFC